MFKIKRNTEEKVFVRFSDLKIGEVFTSDDYVDDNDNLYVFMKVGFVDPYYDKDVEEYNNGNFNAVCLDDGEKTWIDDCDSINRLDAEMTIINGKHRADD